MESPCLYAYLYVCTPPVLLLLNSTHSLSDTFNTNAFPSHIYNSPVLLWLVSHQRIPSVQLNVTWSKLLKYSHSPVFEFFTLYWKFLSFHFFGFTSFIDWTSDLAKSLKFLAVILVTWCTWSDTQSSLFVSLLASCGIPLIRA